MTSPSRPATIAEVQGADHVSPLVGRCVTGVEGTVTAVLGPTNTGKTHLAIERMCAHSSGAIGFPLRLLAREVYDRIVALRGPSVVALVTGEERIVPPRAQYWVCTVEAMPEARTVVLAGATFPQGINGILAQRLVRTLHPEHRERYELPLYLVEELGLPQFQYQDRYEMYRPVPTEEFPTGYLGRQAIVELLRMSDGLRRLVMNHATSGEIHELAVNEGMRTMYLDGLNKCLQGVTSLDEVLRVTQEA